MSSDLDTLSLLIFYFLLFEPVCLIQIQEWINSQRSAS